MIGQPRSTHPQPLPQATATLAAQTKLPWTAAGSGRMEDVHGFVPSRIDPDDELMLEGVDSLAVAELTEFSNADNELPGRVPTLWQEGPAAVAQAFLSEDAPAGEDAEKQRASRAPSRRAAIKCCDFPRLLRRKADTR